MVGVGDRLGSNYVLGQELGRGSMGVVYEARSLSNDERVAVKVLHPKLGSDLEIVGRFVRERQALQRVDHPNIVKVRDLVVDLGNLGIVVELVDGPDLREPQKEHPLDPVQTVDVARQLASGLDEIHGGRVVHRDLKPANVLMVEGRNGALIPKITDFGIAHLTSTRWESLKRLVGTPRYIAPEALREDAEIGPAFDVYALGVVMFELLTGAPPFTGDSTMAVLQAHWKEPAPGVGGVPEDLSRLIDRMLAKKPQTRPLAREVVSLLGEIASTVEPDLEPTRVEATARARAALSRRPPTSAFVKLARSYEERRRVGDDETSRFDISGGDRQADESVDRSKGGPGSRAEADARIAAARSAVGTRRRPETDCDEDDGRPGVAALARSALGNGEVHLPPWALPAVVAVLVLAGLALALVTGGLGGSSETDDGAGAGQATGGQAGALTVQTTLAAADEGEGEPDDSGRAGGRRSVAVTSDDAEPSGRSILATPGDRVRVPDLVGLTLADAQRTLTERGLEPSPSTGETDGEAGRDRVVRSEPGSGLFVDPGSTITLYVGSPTG